MYRDCHTKDKTARRERRHFYTKTALWMFKSNLLELFNSSCAKYMQLIESANIFSSAVPRGPFHLHWWISIPAWIRNDINHRVLGEITYPFPNFNGAVIEVWKWINYFHLTGNVITYSSILGLKLIHVSKRGPGLSTDMILTDRGTYICQQY